MPATYLLPCTCGRKNQVEVRQAGETIQCECGASLEVPTMLKMAELEKVQTRQTAGRPTWGPHQAMILFGALITTVAAGMAVYCILARPRLPDIRAQEPVQTLYYWRFLRNDTDRRTITEGKYAENVPLFRLATGVLLVVACGGVVIVTTSTVMLRKKKLKAGGEGPASGP